MKGFAGIHWVTAAATLASAVGCWGTGIWQNADNPIPPAEAAVDITILEGTAGSCAVAGAQMTTPPDPPGKVGAVNGALTCNPFAADCKPDEYVVIDGDAGVRVVCTIAASGGGFDVHVSVHSGSRMSFEATGHIASTGGVLQMYELDENTERTLQDAACKISIPVEQSQGVVKKGAIWARFQCDSFSDPGDTSGPNCAAAGSFLFENCGS